MPAAASLRRGRPRPCFTPAAKCFMQAYAPDGRQVPRPRGQMASVTPRIVEAEAGGGHVAPRLRRRCGSAANRLSGALLVAGPAPGDRVGTLAWNTQHHLEIYYAAMGAGLVCHTLNPRLTVAHLAAIINEAEDRVLAVAADLAPLMTELAPLCPSIEHIIVMDESGSCPAAAREQARGSGPTRAARDATARRPSGATSTRIRAAGLCYTSGTTGEPQGRPLHPPLQLSAHAARAAGGCHGAHRRATWCWSRCRCSTPMAGACRSPRPRSGAKLVLPGRHLTAKASPRLMRDEKVTVAVGVQTVWLGVVDSLEAAGGDAARPQARAHRRLRLSRSADPPHGGAAGRARPDELGDDRVVAARHDRAGRCRPGGDRALRAGRRWASISSSRTRRGRAGRAARRRRPSLGEGRERGRALFQGRGRRARRRGLFRHGRPRA